VVHIIPPDSLILQPLDDRVRPGRCRVARQFILRNEGRVPAALVAEPSIFKIAQHFSFRGRFKRQRLPEPARLPNAKSNPRDHPDAANNLRWAAETQP
jgi:hypothetical protein